MLLLGFKALLAAVVIAAVLWKQFQDGKCNRCAPMKRVHDILAARRVSKLTVSSLSSGRGRTGARASLGSSQTASTRAALRAAATTTYWHHAFKMCFLLLLFAYPGIALKIMQVRVCYGLG